MSYSIIISLTKVWIKKWLIRPLAETRKILPEKKKVVEKVKYHYCANLKTWPDTWAMQHKPIFPRVLVETVMNFNYWPNGQLHKSSIQNVATQTASSHHIIHTYWSLILRRAFFTCTKIRFTLIDKARVSSCWVIVNYKKCFATGLTLDEVMSNFDQNKKDVIQREEENLIKFRR